MSADAPDMDPRPETFWSHGWNKCKQQPLVPLGIVATCAALMGATSSLRSGNRKQFNKYLRLRVAAQGLTIVAAVAGTLLLTETAQKKQEGRTHAIKGTIPDDPDSMGSLAAIEATPAAKPSSAIAEALKEKNQGSSDSPASPAAAGSGQARHSSPLPPAAAAGTSANASGSGSGSGGSHASPESKWARPSRVSQALFETDRLLASEQGQKEGGSGGQQAGRIQPIKVSEFGRRLQAAEQAHKEEEEARRKARS